jgi:molybdopterin synthase catalytic subunit
MVSTEDSEVRRRLVQLVGQPIHLDRVLASVQSDACGATILFLGTTRGVTGSLRTERLLYDCYEPMALKEMTRLVDRGFEKFGVFGIAVVHRTGVVPVGEASVAIAVAGPHRDETYRCSRYLIDALKKQVPIWKKEFFSDGTTEWVQGESQPAGDP